MCISKKDLVGCVVNGQSVGPLQLGCDDGTDIVSIHASSANVSISAPVSPVQPSWEKKQQEEENRWMRSSLNMVQGHSILCVDVPIFGVESYSTWFADKKSAISIFEMS